MKGIIIQITEEEFQAKLTAAISKALEQYTPPTNDVGIYRTRKEVAEKLHISLPTLNEYTKSGKLRAYRINGRVLYREQDIEAALTSIEPLKYKRK